MESIKTRPPRGSWLAKVLMALFVGMIAMELVLQAAAMTRLFVVTSRSEDVEDSPHILCIGDSFTYGQGATSPEKSYPAVLGQILSERGYSVPVINGGWPGRTSRDLVDVFANRITSQTKVLCILVGTNDSWQHPDLVTDEEWSAATSAEVVSDDSGFSWAWRTPKLISMMFGFESGAWLNAEPDPATSGAAGLGEKAALQLARVRRLEGYKLLLDLGFVAGTPVSSALSKSVSSVVAEYWQVKQSEGLEMARVVITKGLERFPDSSTLLMLHVQTLAQLNKSGEASLRRLEEMCERDPSPESCEALMEALYSVGQYPRAIAMARQRIGEEPFSRSAWIVRQRVAFSIGYQEEFVDSVPCAVSLTAIQQPMIAAEALRNYARVIVAQQPERAARVACAAYLLAPAEAPMRLCLAFLMQHVPRARFSDVLASTEVDDVCKSDFEALLEQVYEPAERDAWQVVLSAHLQMLSQLAASKGAKVVILNYPFYQSKVQESQDETAVAIGADVAAVSDRFKSELTSCKREDLFVPDGHCNDGGYALMAEIVAALVMKHL